MFINVTFSSLAHFPKYCNILSLLERIFMHVFFFLFVMKLLRILVCVLLELLVCLCVLTVDLEQLPTLEMKEFSDGEITIALTSATTDKEVHFYC